MIKKHAEKISPEELQERAMNAGTSWHHHCLAPTCFINDTDEEIVVLEAGEGTFYCDSNKKLREELEEHAYQLNKPVRKSSKPIVHEALDFIKLNIRDGTKWHFHIIMPHCLLGMGDKFVVIVENDDAKNKQEWEFDEKPVELVRAIDDYYLGRK